MAAALLRLFADLDAVLRFLEPAEPPWPFFLRLVLDEAEAEALAYCRREDVPDGLAVAVVRMALVKVNRTGSDGLSSQGYSGTSEAYIDGYPAEIADILRRYRKLVVL